MSNCSLKTTKKWLEKQGYIKGNKVLKNLTPANYSLIRQAEQKFKTPLPEAIYKSDMDILYKDKNGNLRTWDVFFNFVDKQLDKIKQRQREYDKMIKEAYDQELEDAKRAGFTEENFDRNVVYHSFEETDFYQKRDTLSADINNNYAEYYSYKTDLMAKIQHKLVSYKIANRHNKDTEKYKQTVFEYLQVIDDLKKEIEQLKSNEPEIVFSVVANEIEYLTDILNEGNIETIANQEIVDRINFLSKLTTGKDMEGNDSSELMWDGSDYNGYADNIIEPVTKLKTLYSKKIREITKQLLENSEIYQAHKDNLSEEDIEKLFENQTDIDTIQKLFYGLNTNDDTAAITILYSALQENLQRVEQVVKPLHKRLEEIDKKLKDKDFDLEKFYEKDESGVDTGNIIGRFSNKFNKKLKVFNNKLKEFIDAPFDVKSDLYKDVVGWLKDNAEVIDHTKLRHFKEIFGEEYADHFTATNEEMDAYEQELRNLLGKGYDEHIRELEHKLLEFEDYKNKKQINPNQWTDKQIAQSNPWLFVKHYNSPHAFEQAPYQSGNSTYETTCFDIRFFSFIPKKTAYDVDADAYFDTGYYNEKFSEIENNPDAYEYWSTIKDLYTKHINPTYESMGQNISEMSWAKFERTFTEELAKSQGIKGFLKSIIDAIIKQYKELWYEKGYYEEKSGVKVNYNDASGAEVFKVKKLLNLKSISELQKQADANGIQIDSLSELTDGLIEADVKKVTNKYKEDLVDKLARYQVLNDYSKDLTKATLNLSKLATLHKARTETESIVNIVKGFHKSIKDLNGNDRKNSNAKIESWIKKKIYNVQDAKRGDGSFAGKEFSQKYYNKFEKQLLQMMKNVMNDVGGEGSIKFNFEGKEYTKDGQVYKYTDYSESKDGVTFELTKEEFEKILAKHFEEESKRLGIGLTVSGLVQGAIKLTIAKTLSMNLTSGVRNLVEGKFVNMIRDASGEFWTRGNYKHAVNFLRFANITKITNGKLTPRNVAHKKQLQSFKLFLENMNLIQDKKNLLARNDKASKYDRLIDKLNPFAPSVDNPEYKIQGGMILSKLMDVIVKDVNGKEHKFFDGKQLTIYEPGTNKLKPEFRTEENMGWETFMLNDEHKGGPHNAFFSTKMEITDMINQTQGNYFDGDNIAAMDGLFGRAAMVFMRWIPSYFLQRFGERNTNIIQGKDKVVGRYNTLWKNGNKGVGSTFTGIVLGLTFGPTVGLIAGGSALFSTYIYKQIMKSTFDPDTDIKTATEDLQESLDFIKQILLQTINTPINFLGITKNLNDTVIGKKLDTVTDNETLSDEEKYAIRGVAQEVANYLTIIGVGIMLKSLLYADDDDEDDKRRQLYNYIDNQMNMLISGWTAFINPAQTWDDVTSLAVLRLVTDTGKLGKDVIKYMTWGNVEGSQIAYDVSRLNPLLPSVLPNSVNKALFKGEVPFLDNKEYEKGQWHDYLVQSAEKKAKKRLRIERAKYKTKLIKRLTKEYEARGLSPEQIEKKVEKKVRKVMRNKKYSKKKKESYEDALERIEKNLD